MSGFFPLKHLIKTLDNANVKLTSLDLSDFPFSPWVFFNASCVTNLTHFKMDFYTDDDHPGPDLLYPLLRSPIISNLNNFPLTISENPSYDFLRGDELIKMLSSSNMTNNMTRLNLSNYPDDSIHDVIKTLCTARVIPDDETSPLKFGQLQRLILSGTQVDDDDVELIVNNLPQLTHLKLGGTSDEPMQTSLTDRTITTLLASERADPCHPITSLPNLIHLDLRRSRSEGTGDLHEIPLKLLGGPMAFRLYR